MVLKQVIQAMGSPEKMDTMDNEVYYTQLLMQVMQPHFSNPLGGSGKAARCHPIYSLYAQKVSLLYCKIMSKGALSMVAKSLDKHQPSPIYFSQRIAKVEGGVSYQKVH